MSAELQTKYNNLRREYNRLHELYDICEEQREIQQNKDIYGIYPDDEFEGSRGGRRMSKNKTMKKNNRRRKTRRRK